jgi:hypothetical protein
MLAAQTIQPLSLRKRIHALWARVGYFATILRGVQLSVRRSRTRRLLYQRLVGLPDGMAAIYPDGSAKIRYCCSVPRIGDI